MIGSMWMASTFKKMGGKIYKLYRREVLRDGFLLEAKRWFKDRGDETLRLDYDLNEHSIVVDVGGYQGDFAAQIFAKYGATVHIFEPVPSLYARCVERFADNPKIISHCYGLSDTAGSFPISVSENESSFINRSDNQETVIAEVKPVAETFDALGFRTIDLLKINIEGGEYKVLPACIESGWITKISNLQVQFHNFVKDADEQRDRIRDSLSKTHDQSWCYTFVWEGWRLAMNRPAV